MLDNNGDQSDWSNPWSNLEYFKLFFILMSGLKVTEAVTGSSSAKKFSYDYLQNSQETTCAAAMAAVFF